MRTAVRMFALLGAALLALWFFRSGAREVTLVYDLHGVAGARDLDVRIERDGQVLRRADFPNPAPQVRHAMKLSDGTYHVRYAIDAPGAALSGDRVIQVSEPQTIILALGP